MLRRICNVTISLWQVLSEESSLAQEPGVPQFSSTPHWETSSESWCNYFTTTLPVPGHHHFSEPTSDLLPLNFEPCSTTVPSFQCGSDNVTIFTVISQAHKACHSLVLPIILPIPQLQLPTCSSRLDTPPTPQHYPVLVSQLLFTDLLTGTGFNYPSECITPSSHNPVCFSRVWGS